MSVTREVFDALCILKHSARLEQVESVRIISEHLNQPMVDPFEALAGQLRLLLTPKAIAVLMHDRFKATGWAPNDPRADTIEELVRNGMFRRSDARCGFELEKDAWVSPTVAGMMARSILLQASGVDRG